MSSYIDPRHKILYHTDRLAAIKAGKKPAPINIEIDLSNRCSLGCEWCHFAYTHTRGPLAGKVDTPNGRIPGGDLMDYELAKEIIIQAHAMGVRSITWTGGGEPTLHPRFDDVVTFAHRHGMPQGLYTNGVHITPERAALLKRVMSWVYVSLDECETEMYKESKGVDKFEAVCEGTRSLSAAEGNATIGVGFLLHKYNYLDTRQMIRLGLNLGADYVQFRPTVDYSQDHPSKRKDFPEWIDELLNMASPLENDKVLFDRERFEMYRDWNGRSYTTCHWTQVQAVITPNGKVWACVNKREHAAALLGDLIEEPLPTIWQRSGACTVDGSCRVMCRGHIANITLDAIMTEPPHKEFV
jgi:MoaA/NifB/PqqE/SkfB family radical SAM enzyme